MAARLRWTPAKAGSCTPHAGNHDRGAGPQRAEIIVLRGAGMTQAQIAVRLGVSRVTVNDWCQRFLARRLAGLDDAPGRGRKPSLPPEAVRMVLEKP